jgi:hypothetical protein
MRAKNQSILLEQLLKKKEQLQSIVDLDINQLSAIKPAAIFFSTQSLSPVLILCDNTRHGSLESNSRIPLS